MGSWSQESRATGLVSMLSRILILSILISLCLSQDEFSRKRRIPYHLPGFWYHFLPRPIQDMKRYSFPAKRSDNTMDYYDENIEQKRSNYEVVDFDDLGFLEDGKIPADGTLFGWDKRRRRSA